jgi:hypothetical protein
MGWWNGFFSIERVQNAVKLDADFAKKKTIKQEIALRTPRRRRPKKVPRRGRMTRQVLEVPPNRWDRENRALIFGFLFWIIGGAIVMFAIGVPLRTPPKTEGTMALGLALSVAVGILGAIIGWFSGKRRRYRIESYSEGNGKEHQDEAV